MQRSAAAVAAALGLAIGDGAGAQVLANAVEYYHAAFDQYFVTVDPAEVLLLDGGAHGGAWVRTGQSFPVWSQPGPYTHATCRFFSAAFAPKSSHFYTPGARECALLQAGATWQYEGIAFHLRLPDALGNCPVGTSNLYRLYNGGRGDAPNHRYTSSRHVFDQMRNQGWLAEGVGATLAFACVPSPSAALGAEGLYRGSTSLGQSLWGVVLPEGTISLMYGRPDSAPLAGVVHGRAAFADGAFYATGVRDFNVLPHGRAMDAVAGGTYVPGTSLNGTVANAGGAWTYSATHLPSSRSTASLAQASGSYTGTVASIAGAAASTFTVDTSGVLAGLSPACAYWGRLVPSSALNAYDLYVRLEGPSCPFGGSALAGVAVYESSARLFYGVAPNAARTDAFMFVGNR
jgi:hypothetical protein